MFHVLYVRFGCGGNEKNKPNNKIVEWARSVYDFILSKLKQVFILLDLCYVFMSESNELYARRHILYSTGTQNFRLFFSILVLLAVAVETIARVFPPKIKK